MDKVIFISPRSLVTPVDENLVLEYYHTGRRVERNGRRRCLRSVFPRYPSPGDGENTPENSNPNPATPAEPRRSGSSPGWAVRLFAMLRSASVCSLFRKPTPASDSLLRPHPPPASTASPENVAVARCRMTLFNEADRSRCTGVRASFTLVYYPGMRSYIDKIKYKYSRKKKKKKFISPFIDICLYFNASSNLIIKLKK